MSAVFGADLQNVNITLRILFRPVADRLPDIFTNLGIDYDERVLPSIVNEVLKAVVVSVLRCCVLFIVLFTLRVSYLLRIRTTLHFYGDVNKTVFSRPESKTESLSLRTCMEQGRGQYLCNNTTSQCM